MSVDEDWQMLLRGAIFQACSMHSASFELLICAFGVFRRDEASEAIFDLFEKQDNFVLIKGYTDFGTEVEYLYNPKSGEADKWTGHGHIRTPKRISPCFGSQPYGFRIHCRPVL